METDFCAAENTVDLEREFDVNEIANLIDLGNITLSEISKKKIKNALRIEFQKDEIEDQVLETIASCAEDYQTDKYFFATRRNSSDPASELCFNGDSKQ